MRRYNYDTLEEALDDIKKRGYTIAFSLRPYCLECPRSHKELGAGEFEVDEVHRAKRTSGSDKESVLYAISSSEGLKGTLVDTHETFADAVTPEMARKLKVDYRH